MSKCRSSMIYIGFIKTEGCYYDADTSIRMGRLIFRWLCTTAQ